ncbi:MAG: IS630 transposase-related protein [Candidatus Sericytochromatia bacterium]
MGKAYSLDLREKVFEAYTRSKIKDKTKIAKRFKVSYDFVNNLINLHEETGSLCPRKRTGNKATKMTIETLDYLSNLVKESNDYTLSELSDKLRKDKGIETGTTTIFVALRKLGISLKKNHIYQRKEIVKK